MLRCHYFFVWLICRTLPNTPFHVFLSAGKKTALVVALAVKAGPWVIRQCLCGTVTWPVWLSLPLGKTHRLMELPQWH